jgi:hypothetical protein
MPSFLPAGRSVCPKRGRIVEQPETGLDFFDIPPMVYSGLVEKIGRVGAGIIAVAVFLLLWALFIGLALM